MKNREFEKNSIILFVLMMSANVINYLFQIIIGRFLNDVADYGTINALLSIFNILSLPCSIIAMFVSKYVAEYDMRNNYSEMKQFIIHTSKVVFLLTIVVSVCGSLLSREIAKYIHVDNRILVVLIITGAAISYFMQVGIGFFQGTKKFVSYGVYNIVASTIKIILCIILLLLGYRIWGIIVAIVLDCIMVAVIGGVWLGKYFKNIETKQILLEKKKTVEFLYTTIFLNVGIILLNNFDIILIKHYFVEEAGYYSVASALGKILCYFSNAIVVTLFPFVITEKGNSEGATKILKKALLYGGIIAAGAGSVLSLLAEFIINIMYGTVYVQAADYMLPICFFVTALSILTIIANYDVALEQANFVTISMILAVVLDIVIVMIYHENIIVDIWLFALILWLVTIINIIRVFMLEKKDY